MIQGERLVLLCAALCIVVPCGSEKTNKRTGKHLLALLGYLHGYKIGQQYALQLSPYLVSPIIVLPSANQQQSVTIQQGANDDNYQENGGTIQTIAPIRIVALINDTSSTAKIHKNITDIEKSSDNKEIISNTEKLSDDYDDIEIKPKAPKMNSTNDVENVTEIFVHGDTGNKNGTEPTNATNIDKPAAIIAINNTTDNNGTSVNNVTYVNNTGPYPEATYNTEIINNISLTTNADFTQSNQALPPVDDNRWHNFTLRANLSNLMSDNNATVINEANSSMPPSEIVTKPPQEKGPYPNAWYNNEAIDQLSITTNDYTNESPSQVDGWGSYSSMNELPSGFKPLAGLYYDGFLHRPLKKYGFVPQNYYWK